MNKITVIHMPDEDGWCGHFIEGEGIKKFLYAHPSPDETVTEFIKWATAEAFGSPTAEDRIDWENCIVGYEKDCD